MHSVSKITDRKRKTKQRRTR
jgi:hypothetical protein